LQPDPQGGKSCYKLSTKEEKNKSNKYNKSSHLEKEKIRHLISHQDENEFNMEAKQHENKVQSWQSAQRVKYVTLS
jgi:hypothetical protein